MIKKGILFVQRHPRRAGAQTSLYRLLKTSPTSSSVVLASEGWLSEALPDSLIYPWPSPRSLSARIGGTKRFAEKFSKELRARGLNPSIVIANDHHECIPTLAISRRLSIPSAAILRTPGMTQADFQKHRCMDIDHLFIVGNELASKVRKWGSQPHSLYQEGFLEDEFSDPSKLPSSLPDRLLVAGSEEPRKGFSDLILALKLLEETQPEICFKEITFTGNPPNMKLPDLNCQMKFVGRIDNFVDFAKNFSFAIHPSRHETFGLAPLELVIAGIPTLCSRTGIADEHLLPESWLIEPNNPKDIVSKIIQWHTSWKSLSEKRDKVIANIRTQFHIENSVRPFYEVISLLTSAPPPLPGRRTVEKEP